MSFSFERKCCARPSIRSRRLRQATRLSTLSSRPKNRLLASAQEHPNLGVKKKQDPRLKGSKGSLESNQTKKKRRKKLAHSRNRTTHDVFDTGDQLPRPQANATRVPWREEYRWTCVNKPGVSLRIKRTGFVALPLFRVVSIRAVLPDDTTEPLKPLLRKRRLFSFMRGKSWVGRGCSLVAKG